jgi:hypothetical protein
MSCTCTVEYGSVDHAHVHRSPQLFVVLTIELLLLGGSKPSGGKTTASSHMARLIGGDDTGETPTSGFPSHTHTDTDTHTHTHTHTHSLTPTHRPASAQARAHTHTHKRA